jgi:hypothetical protein
MDEKDWIPLTGQQIFALYNESGLGRYMKRDNVIQTDYERKLLTFARGIEHWLKENNTCKRS